MDVVRALRWKHVTGELSGEDYDGVLNGIFGERGSAKREVWEMRTCCGYVSQTLRQARIDSGLIQEELFAKWGSKMIAATWSTQRTETGPALQISVPSPGRSQYQGSPCPSWSY